MYIYYTNQHKLHATDQAQHEGYPLLLDEVPERAEIILRAIETVQLGPIIAPTDHGLDPILAVHEADFVTFLQTAYTQSQTLPPKAPRLFPDTFATRYTGRKPEGFPSLRGYYAFDPYSPILAGTWTAAYWSAQCALSAADSVLAGEQAVYALCRPPGHHAAADLYGGFCYLNNAAIAARYLQTQASLPAVSGQRPALRPPKGGVSNGSAVAILDIDYHHGNGTQEIFYADPSMLYCSLHAHPDEEYPYYWGQADERGEGAGEGYTYNWPLPRGTDETSYLTALSEAFAVIQDFAPQFLIISVGFDIFIGDPVGGFEITTTGLAEIGAQIATLTRSVPTVIVQEGGYVRESLGENAVAFLKTIEDSRW